MSAYLYSVIIVLLIILISYVIISTLNVKENFQLPYHSIVPSIPSITKDDLKENITKPLNNIVSNISTKSSAITNNLSSISNNLTDINGKLNYLTGYYSIKTDDDDDDKNEPDEPKLEPPQPTQQDTNKAYQDLLHQNKLEYEKEIKEGKSPTFTTPEILLKDSDGKPLASQKYLSPEFAQKLSAYMADYNKKKQIYDNYQKNKKKDDKKTPQNQVPRDYYKKSFNVPTPEKFTSFEFIEGFRY